MKFQLHSEYKPTGDQPTAIKQLIDGLDSGVREQTLLGVTGSGKSVTGETIIMITKKGVTIQKPIATVVDSLFKEYPQQIQTVGESEFINFNDLPASEHMRTLSFNSKTGVNSWQKLTQISRHQANEVAHIQLSSGQSVSSTLDHNFFTLREGKPTLVDGSQLKVGDLLPTPRQIDGPRKPLVSIVVPQQLRDLSGMYIGLRDGVTIDKLSGYSIPYSKKWRIVHQAERILATAHQATQIRQQVLAKTIGSRTLVAKIPYQLELSDALLRFIGYYIAEGHSTERYVIITSADNEVVSDIYAAMGGIGLRTAHRINPYDYQINSMVFARLMGDMCGHGAFSKKLPEFWMQLSDSQLAQLLSAYFAGDGGVEKAAITATTASDQLASDLQYALLRFGILARNRSKKVRLPGGAIGRYNIISISGRSNMTKFARNITFSLSRKQQALQLLLDHEVIENTNVDLIPLYGNDIRVLRERFGLFQINLAKAVGSSRSHISLIETGVRRPSRTIATRLINFLIQEAAHRNDQLAYKQIMEMASLLQNNWSPVRSIDVESRNRMVYDFAVNENETFLAGSGGIFVHNTFTMANIIQDRQVPTLVLAHNKTLAAQLYSEFKSFFPDNEVHYFVSYFDYYQPEAYMASSDTYIEKDSKINDEIDRLRHAATMALLTRRDTIIVASVSCIYGIGSPDDYSAMSITVKKGERRLQDKFVRLLTDIQYQRNDIDFHRGTFRVKGDVVDVFPAGSDVAYRIEFFGDEVDRLTRIDPLTGEILAEPDEVSIFPSSHYVTPKEKLAVAIEKIKQEFAERVEWFEKHDKLLEAQRLSQRTKYDIEMLEETGFVKGIENYSRYLTNREPGEQPATLLDYFSDDFLLLVDESHMTLPQVRGMYNGDRARKEVLVEYGFRMPSALDNRPLTFAEFDRHINQAIYVSATPGEYELAHSPEPAQQIIRPTGLIDPEIVIRPTEGQIDDLVAEIRDRTAHNQRVLVTTLTKRMAEDLSAYLQEIDIKTAYIHSEVDTLERGDIIRDLRMGVYDVLVGINLLREGLDLPEVSMVAIMDADKEGFLRSSNALIQTIGRAARHLEGKVLMYADRVTDSMQQAIDETARRRAIQTAYNTEHNITPESIAKEIDEGLRSIIPKKEDESRKLNLKKIPKDEYPSLIKELSGQMELASANLEFEKAAELRDMITDLRNKL